MLLMRLPGTPTLHFALASWNYKNIFLLVTCPPLWTIVKSFIPMKLSPNWQARKVLISNGRRMPQNSFYPSQLLASRLDCFFPEVLFPCHVDVWWQLRLAAGGQVHEAFSMRRTGLCSLQNKNLTKLVMGTCFSELAVK